jgi:hypothetical protein
LFSIKVKEGDTATFNWICPGTPVGLPDDLFTCVETSAPPGSSFTSTIGNPASATFTWPNAGPPGEYIHTAITRTVFCAQPPPSDPPSPPRICEDSLPSTLTIIVNHPPIANAGVDLTVNSRDLVTLDSSGSSDADGDQLTDAWSQIGGPSVALNDGPSFTAPEVDEETTLTFQLIVNDGLQDSPPDTVSIIVRPNPCPAEVDTVPVILEPITTTPQSNLKPFQISYGELPLEFTSASETSNVCTLESSVGSLPVLITWPDVAPQVRIQIATSTASAQLNFFSAEDTSNIPQCTFPNSNEITENCFLTALPDSPNDVVVQWSTSGFEVSMAERLTSTGPKEFWVSADALSSLGVDSSNVLTPTGISTTENFIHRTVSNFLLFVEKIGMIQDPPANDILVTDPNGHRTGKTQTGQTLTEIPGSLYIALDEISAVVFPEPPEGIYQLQVIGKSVGPFDISSSTTELLGDFVNPSTNELIFGDTIEQEGEIKTYNLLLLGEIFEVSIPLPPPASECVGTGSRNKIITGTPDPDILIGTAGQNIINGRHGDDRINGCAGNDMISGNAENDGIAGGAGNDKLQGNEGNDAIQGDSGNDWISGGKGVNILTGGPGRDQFICGSKGDIVTDFQLRQDRKSGNCLTSLS